MNQRASPFNVSIFTKISIKFNTIHRAKSLIFCCKNSWKLIVIFFFLFCFFYVNSTLPDSTTAGLVVVHLRKSYKPHQH
uniref:Uncharacterized protein n=1 Tax=Lotus japonicus TaxID=34305 RepID=I3SMU8_LOTJA|nr:unknown [Lotus japonicus]